jgi:hypothetical protein
MNNKLFIVEGLPCAGKSMISKYVADSLKEKEYKVEWVDEGTGNHPADYEYHSYLTHIDLQKLTVEEKTEILNKATNISGGYIIDLSELQGELLEKVLPYKIYDNLPWEIEKEIMLDGWRRFTQAADNETIYVFNCCFLQNPMCETMMRFGFKHEVSREYILSIWQIIKELNPVIIYLKEDNINDKIQMQADKRGKEWLSFVIDYHVNGRYGKDHNLSGYEGYIECLIERQQRELNILDEIGGEKLTLINSNSDWDDAHSKIDKYVAGLMR